MNLTVLLRRLRKTKPLRFGVLLGTGLVIVAGAVLIVAAYDGATLGLEPGTDKGTVVAVALTAVGVLIAVAAALVAVAAYLTASGEADLSIEVCFNFSELNAPRFRVLPPRDGDGWIPLQEFKQVAGSIVLRNASKYAARNPSVAIKFEGMTGPPEGMIGWEITRYGNMVGPTEFLWDGGSDRMIHGQGARKLPEINLYGACVLPDNRPTIIVTAYADGLKPVTLALRVATWTEGEPETPEAQL